jgi:hypothetical protein
MRKSLLSDCTEITVIEPETKEISPTLAREDNFIELLGKSTSIRQAALEAGYSEAYSNTDVYKKFKSDRFLKRLKQHYNGYSHALLPKILNIESKVVDLLLEDPSQVPKFRHTLKEIKQSSGVLDQDNAPRAPTIRINNVKNLLLKAHED